MTKHKGAYFSISIAITVVLICFAFFGCFVNLQRFLSSIIDVGVSFAYYFCEFAVILFDIENPISPTVIQLPTQKVDVIFPETFDKFEQTFANFGKLFFDKTNFIGWWNYILDKMYQSSVLFMFLVPFILVVFLLCKMAFSGQNNDFDVKSKALVRWLKFEDKVIFKVKAFVNGYFAFVEKNHVFKVIWKLILLVSLNIFTVFLEAFAYLLYFAVSMDIFSLYTQVYKLIVDLFLMFRSLPAIVWLVVAYVIFLRIRQNIAFDRLDHMEMRNKGWANSLGVCTMFTGNMGVGKTKLMTDVSLSLSTVYKHNAKDIILKIERWFPEFPWATYQNLLRRLVWFHVIFNLTSCEDFVIKKRKRFEKAPSNEKLYGYDFERFGLYYNNELQNIYLLQILEEYTKAFFLYYLAKSYILGNYGVREDGIMIDKGNLPLWNYDFFSRDAEFEDDVSYFANVLDFDMLRKGKIVKKGNPFADTFEFGIVNITELDKERGNMLDNQELKKRDEETNRKNDLFNYSPKMGRHPATILYQPFISFLFDQQRPSKTEADLREVCDKVVNIDFIRKENLALPFFFVEEILYSIIAPIYHRTYEKYRFNRADNSLTIYLFKKTFGRFMNWYERIYNLYGFDTYTLVSDSGKLDGKKLTSDKYFLLYKKALSNRYSTDCYKEFFRQLSRLKNIGIVDYLEFDGIRATPDELRLMNSYFIGDMDKVFSVSDTKK